MLSRTYANINTDVPKLSRTPHITIRTMRRVGVFWYYHGINLRCQYS